MQRTLMKSKIHQATVTDANLRYEGSITIDAKLMQAADLVPFERVQVVDLNNGVRLETYCVQGPVESGTICVNGAAARLIQVADTVIIISYATLSETEARTWRPKVVHLDMKNRITEKTLDPAPTESSDLRPPWQPHHLP